MQRRLFHTLQIRLFTVRLHLLAFVEAQGLDKERQNECVP